MENPLTGSTQYDSLVIVLCDGPATGPENMARDSALLAAAELGKGQARVYSWEGPCISLGYSQRPDRDLLSGQPVPTVMRPTGGKAVLHGHDATVGLALPLAWMGVENSRQLKTIYRHLAIALAEALRDCGLPAVLGEETPFVRGRMKTTDCFAHVAACDIVDPKLGQKTCGCALKVTETAVLLQASIPCGPPLVDPALIFQEPQTALSPVWDKNRLPECLERTLARFGPRLLE